MGSELKFAPGVFSLIVLLAVIPPTSTQGRVKELVPNRGSIQGGNLLEIRGEGFSPNQFSLNNASVGNEVVFIHTITKRILSCDIIETDTHDQRILCETHRSPTGNADYLVKIKVDGKWLNDDKPRTWCGGNCYFHYRSHRTPTITAVTPHSGLPGDIVKVKGVIQTTQISRLSTDFDPARPELAKSFLGNEICEPFDVATNELIGAGLDVEGCSNVRCGGWYKCQPATKTVGSWNASFITSDNGRSLREKGSYFVDGNDEAYTFQTYADVSTVSPNAGSKIGGQLITITGRYFTTSVANTVVTVQGVPCKVISASKTEVKCVTGPLLSSRANDSNPYAGARGAMLELWQKSNAGSFPDFSKFDENSTLYARHILRDTLSFSDTEWPDIERSHGKLTGFFVPPHTGLFTFLIKNDDIGQLLMSQSESVSNMSIIAYTPQYSSKSYFKFPSQKSAKRLLTKGQPYYFEFDFLDYGAAYHAEMAVLMDDTKKTASQVQGAYDEKQRISINSVYFEEKQILNITAASEVTFQLTYGGRYSGLISSNAAASTVKTELNTMFSWVCSYSPPTSIGFYFQDFEGEAEKGENGYRKTVDRPNCGRRALNIDSYVYVYNSGFSTKNGVKLGLFDLKTYNKLCFAYKGPVSTQLNIRFRYQDTDYDTVTGTRTYSYTRSSNLLIWNYACVDIYMLVSEDSWVKSSVSSTPNLKLDYIIAYREGSGAIDALLDDVWIGKEDMTVALTLPAAMPNGALIESFDVTKLRNHSWEVRMKPFKCRTNLGLIAVKGNATVNVTADRQTYELANSSMLTVERRQSASPPIKGTFTVMYDGLRIEGIDADIQPQDLAATLERDLRSGELSVLRGGTCSGYYWEVEWIGIGGNKPEFIVDGAKLTGDGVTIGVTTITDGGLMLAPIPAEYLRLPEKNPQVVVSINNIVSACINSTCSYSYNDSWTPKITSVSPAQGSCGPTGTCTVITINGSGFSSANKENSVTVGGVVCQVITSSATSITCCVGSSQAGTHILHLHVRGKGNAMAVNGAANFKCNLVVNSFQPKSGSTAGGTEVTILGTGFGTVSYDVKVLFDDTLCDVLSINDSRIVCLTGARTPGNATLKVAILDEVTVVPDSFEYTASLTPIITSVTSDILTVTGGVILRIQGTSLDATSGASPNVTIGRNPCSILNSSATEIYCTTPPNAPGKHLLAVYVMGKGLAQSPQLLDYTLALHRVYPEAGSALGGTILTLQGLGFVWNTSEVQVDIGRTKCDVISAASEVIKCMTQKATKVFAVDNSGRHPDYGIGYAWNITIIDMNVGDSILWQWASNPLSDLSIGVFQTTEIGTEYDGSGFYSSRGSSGHFMQRFDKVGTYYFSSGPIDPGKRIVMGGKIKVHGLKVYSGNIHLKVGGYEANYSRIETNASVPSDCYHGVTTNFTSCSLVSTNNTSYNDSFQNDTAPNTHPFQFTFAPCSTPIIESFAPRWITMDTDVVINGKGFSSQPCQNYVKLGGHNCSVTSSTDTQISCRINTATSPPVNTHLMISIHVHNRGNALIQIDSPINETLKLRPIISGFTPTVGSLAGGTKTTIKGSGFMGLRAIVTIGSVECKITRVTYTEIDCSTGRLANFEEKSWPLNVYINNEAAICNQSECLFNYTLAATPVVVDILDREIRSSAEQVILTGVRFGSNASLISVAVGPTVCNVTQVNNTHIICVVYGAPAGNHKLHVHKFPSGNAWYNTSDTVQCIASVTGVTPNRGSIYGGTEIIIDGVGFDPTFGRVSVTIDGNLCNIMSVTYTKVTCSTSPGTGSKSIVVRSGEVSFPPVTFAYDTSISPTVTSLSSIKGHSGQNITIYGSNLSPNSGGDVTVKFGDAQCSVIASSNTSIQCNTSAHPAGSVPVKVHVGGKGHSNSNFMFEFDLVILSISPTQSGFGGGVNVTMNGYGFSSNDTVRICNETCHTFRSILQDTKLTCESPMINPGSFTTDLICSVDVTTASGISKTLPNAYTYKSELTSIITGVSPRRGGTGGGVRLTITGSGLYSTSGPSVVTIDGNPCAVMSASSSEIVCITTPSSRTIETDIRVDVGKGGRAVPLNASFFYVDVWSSKFSWGGLDPPVAGDFVIIKKGQTMLLDVDTPVFKILLIQGGKLIFDEKDIHLQAENILITDGGMFRVGESPEKPFQHKATITIHGHVRSTELPVYGAKSVSVRNGSLELYGKHVMHTWTRLSETANAGSKSIKLQLSVSDWSVGDEIVIASTSKSLRENEVVKIIGIRDGGRTLDIAPPLDYTHISFNQTIAGHMIETRAEVGLLTRNVVVQGSMEQTWLHKIENCPRDFEPGQFKRQTCFDGRFGEERGSDQFGVQIIMHSGTRDSRAAKGYFHYVEVRHAGQAFRLGRYPIHFHMDGDVSGSYVKGCAIHHSFNRAVTIHGVHNLVVEENVIYDILGNAFFMENGIETGNVMRYNLGIFVKPSSTTLNVDITPGTYWVTNANNTVSHNAAAGGTHFGYWYQMFEHPDGPSFTTSICPRNVPMLEFRNNSAHSFGRYGLWIFPIYHPKKGGSCGATVSESAVFHSLFSWNNMRGAEIGVGGAVQFVENVVLDNDLAGIDVIQADAGNSPWGGAMVRDSLIIGHSHLGEYNRLFGSDQRNCTEAGIQLPASPRLIVSNVTFVNFDVAPGCAAIRACSRCSSETKKGGWPTRFEKLKFVNSPRISNFGWNFQAVFEDLDGTLTGHAGGTALPSNPTLPPSLCSLDNKFSIGLMNGSVCMPGVAFRRLAWNNILPSLLNTKNAIISNRFGSTETRWSKKSTTHALGWMAVVLLNESTTIGFEMGNQITNISYSMKVYELRKNDHLYVRHQFFQEPDFFTTTGATVNGTIGIPDPMKDSHGAWNFKTPEKSLTILAKGDPASTDTLPRPMSINLRVYRCFFLKCVVPTPPPAPKGRPANAVFWSKPADWKGTPAGYGGYNGILPKDGDNVMINSDKWMVVDVQTPKINRLYIYGVLELDYSRSHNISANIIFISGLHGNLIVGWPDKPMVNNVIIRLLGNHATQDMPLNNGPNVGAKALAVFSRLQLFGKPRFVSWTGLARTINVGDHSLVIEKAPDWIVGDEILISSSTYEPRQAEKFRIASINGSKITVNGTFKFKHLGGNYSIGNHVFRMAAKVALLTRNIVIEGADDPVGSLGNQSFGCRVLVGSYADAGIRYRGKAMISNVQFKNCGQYGWNEDYDPRYALSFLNLGPIQGNESFVRGSSFQDGFNTGLGIFGTDNLLIEDNVLYHVVGAGIRNRGSGTQLLRNLIILAIAPHTFKGLLPPLDLFWPGGIEVIRAKNTTMIGNVVAGSERVGFLIPGESCTAMSPERGWKDNEAHSCLHGLHVDKEHNFGDCARVSNFFSWKNYDYGIFSYASCSIIVSNCTFADNGNSLFLYVGTPSSLTHIRKDRFVKVEDSVLIGVSPFYDCVADSVIPMPATIIGFRAVRASKGGMVGSVIPSFISTTTPGPLKPWHEPTANPAIGGRSSFNRTLFANFVKACGKTTPIFKTNPFNGDASHPMELQAISLINVTEDLKASIQTPTMKWVNPADCVDMDCDGLRKIVIKDIDGSFFGNPGGSLISRSEYQWDGARSFGLGNFRIPKTMLSNADGTRIDADMKYPHKGIVRGTRNLEFCSFKEEFGAYYCTGLDFFFLVIETMDQDTETRRRSPVALAANGYIDLINGPMDHGCCFGYTCQERISTFYSVAAARLNYELQFTSYTPHTLRLHFLNSEMKDAIVLKIYYANPQRLDVYYKGVYILPTNGKYQGEDFELLPKDPTKPADQYLPTLNGNPGLNYFDSDEKFLYVVVKGPEFIEIRTTSVIQLRMGVSTKSVSLDEFFQKNLIRNLAALFGIDDSRIRVMNVISAGGARKRRSSDLSFIEVQIGDPPLNTTVSSNNSTRNQSSFSELEHLTNKVVQSTQTGLLSTASGLDIDVITVEEPSPAPVDPTGGFRATTETFQVLNGTRYDEKVVAAEIDVVPVDYYIPKKIVLIVEPTNSNETVPFSSHPSLRMYDALNRWVHNLGRESDRWRVTAGIVAGTGDSSARLMGETTAEFVNGTANFTNLAVSHKGTGYKLYFNVTYPFNVSFFVESNAFQIKERVLAFTLLQQPTEANETVPFDVQPRVEVRDAANGELVNNTGWKGRKWLFTASIVQNGNAGSGLMGSTSVEFEGAFATFKNVSIDSPGNGYQLLLNVFTSPASTYTATFTTAAFDVKERELYLRIAQQPGDCNDTVVCGSQPILEVRSKYPDALAGNLGWKGWNWYINASMQSSASNAVLNGTQYLKIPTSGRVQFTDLNFYEVAVGYKLSFHVIVIPHNPRFANLTAISNSFDVKQRQFYLAVKQSPKDANDSVIFGQQPIIEVRDLGTNLAAKPLKTYWNVTAYMKNNAAGNGSLQGTSGVDVIGEMALFSDLRIIGYGVGYTLEFKSNYGHSVTTAPFNVRFRNDYRPVFNLSTPSLINVYENQTAPVTLYTFIATDNDVGIAGKVTYSMAPASLDWLFSLSSNTGSLTLMASLDRENASSYAITISAHDSAPSPFFFTTSHALTLNVLDVNDNKPYYPWPVLNITVPETVGVGEPAFNVTTTDADAGENGRITYTVTSSNASGKFLLNENTGVFTAQVSLDLDKDDNLEPLYHFLMTVRDNGIEFQQSVDISVYVRVVRVNEYSPHFNPDKITVSVKEDVPVGSIIATLNATDADSREDGNITYVITSGNADSVFSINNGSVILKRNLDREMVPYYGLVITAFDNPINGAQKSSTLTVTVNVIDVNDNKPTFSKPSYILEVPENAAIGIAAVSVVANDPDSGLNGQLEYTILSGSNPLFRLEKQTGSFIPLASLDLDSQNLNLKSYEMTVFVKDKGQPTSLNDTVNVTLRIIAVNEYAPSLSHPAEVTMLLGSSMQIGDLVFKINATDDDFGEDGRLKHEILAGNDDGVFSLNALTGSLSLAKIPSGPFYAIEMTVSDNGTNPGPKSTKIRLVMYNERSSSGTGAGSVYVGSSRASVPISAVSGTTVKVPVYANVGFQDLEGIDVTLSYDAGILSYESATTDLITLPGSGTIRMVGLVKPDGKLSGIPKIADLMFTGLFSISVNITPSAVLMADKSGKRIPVKVKGPSCAAVLLGNLNDDCIVDITDAALVQTYARELRTSFSSAIGKAIYNELSPTQKANMDVDKNNIVDYHDGTFLLHAIVNYTKLISSFVVQPPSYPTCDLKVSTELKSTDQTAATNTRTFVVFTYMDSTLNAELTLSSLTGISSYTLTSGLNRYGRVFEMSRTSNGMFQFTGVKPRITKNNVGVTLIIVTKSSSFGSKVSSSFKKPANITGSKTTVSLASGITIDVFDSYVPQRMVNFSTLNELCNGVTVSKHLQLTFNSDYSVINGKEAKFIIEFKSFFEAKYRTATREVAASNITVKAGSIIVDFDVTVTQAQESQFISDITNDVKNGMTFRFESTSMVAAQTLKVDDVEKFPPPPAAKSDNTVLIIVVVVVACVLFITFIIFVCFWKIRKTKRVQSFRVDSRPDSKAGQSPMIEMFRYDAHQRGDGESPFYGAEDSKCQAEIDVKGTSVDNCTHQSNGAHSDMMKVVISSNETSAPSSRPPSSKADVKCIEEPNEARLNAGLESKPSFDSFKKSHSDLELPSDGHITMPKTAKYSDAEENSDSDCDVESFRMHPNVPTPELGYHNELNDDHPVFRTFEVKQLRNEGLKVLHHVCEIEANVNGTLEDLRAAFADDSFLNKQKLVFLTSKLHGVDPKVEANVKVKDIFKNAIRIKILHGTDGYSVFCPCGSVARLQCKNCLTRGYCSLQCQADDSADHEKVCDEGNKTQIQRDGSKRMSRVFSWPVHISHNGHDQHNGTHHT